MDKRKWVGRIERRHGLPVLDWMSLEERVVRAAAYVNNEHALPEFAKWYGLGHSERWVWRQMAQLLIDAGQPMDIINKLLLDDLVALARGTVSLEKVMARYEMAPLEIKKGDGENFGGSEKLENSGAGKDALK